MRFVVLGLLVLLTVAPVQAAGSWTVLLYLVADDDSPAIEDAAIRDLDQLALSGPPGGVTFLAQVDRGSKLSPLMRERYQDPNYSGVMRYRIEKDKWVKLGQPGELNSGDPKVLLDFVNWGLEQAPAENVMLVISSHGSGTMSWRGVGAVGSATPGEVRLDPYVGYDDKDNDCLTLFELARVLESVATKRGKPVDILGLDACYSSSIEALYQLRKGTRTIVASESLMPMTGLEYLPLVGELHKNPSLPTDKVCEILVKSFIDAQSSGNEVLGAFRTSAADDLASSLESLSQELVRALRQVGSIGLKNLTAFAKDDLYWDLKRIAERIGDPATDLKGAANAAELRQAAAAVIEARRAATISLWYMGTYAEQKIGGLSLYWPARETYAKHRSFYRALALSQDTHWDEFLDLRLLGQ